MDTTFDGNLLGISEYIHIGVCGDDEWFQVYVTCYSFVKCHVNSDVPTKERM